MKDEKVEERQITGRGERPHSKYNVITEGGDILPVSENVYNALVTREAKPYYNTEQDGAGTTGAPTVRVGDHVTVHDRYRFAIPLRAEVMEKSTVNDGVRVKLLQSNNSKYPVGDETVWVSESQLRKSGVQCGTPADSLRDRKADEGKLEYDLVPPDILPQLIAVLMSGNRKYVKNSWKDAVREDPSKYYDALMRHVEAWRGGERKDREDGLPHLAHAMCCLMFLLWKDLRSKATDSPNSHIQKSYQECPVEANPHAVVAGGTRPTWEGDERRKS